MTTGPPPKFHGTWDILDESTYELLPGGALHVSGQAGFAPREIIYSAAAWHRLYVYDEGPGSRPG
jgi:hypothetical protein